MILPRVSLRTATAAGGRTTAYVIIRNNLMQTNVLLLTSVITIPVERWVLELPDNRRLSIQFKNLVADVIFYSARAVPSFPVFTSLFAPSIGASLSPFASLPRMDAHSISPEVMDLISNIPANCGYRMCLGEQHMHTCMNTHTHLHACTLSQRHTNL